MAEPDRLLTVLDFYDLPREGIATFRGAAHYFVCIFDDRVDEWSDFYFLKPLDPETIDLVMEWRQIRLRWAEGFQRDRAEGKIGWALPKDRALWALPEDRARNDELQKLIRPALAIDPAREIAVRGEFIKTGGDTADWPDAYKVRWTEIHRNLVGHVERVGGYYCSS